MSGSALDRAFDALELLASRPAGVPLASTASGQAWLACLTDEQAVALASRQGFPSQDAHGPNAPRTVRALLERLRAARGRGYARVAESSAPGTSAMAAAVRHPATRGVIGVVSVAGPSVRLTDARMDELAPVLLEAAAELADASATSEYFTAIGRGSIGAASPPAAAPSRAKRRTR